MPSGWSRLLNWIHLVYSCYETGFMGHQTTHCTYFPKISSLMSLEILVVHKGHLRVLLLGSCWKYSELLKSLMVTYWQKSATTMFERNQSTLLYCDGKGGDSVFFLTRAGMFVFFPVPNFSIQTKCDLQWSLSATWQIDSSWNRIVTNDITQQLLKTPSNHITFSSARFIVSQHVWTASWNVGHIQTLYV